MSFMQIFYSYTMSAAAAGQIKSQKKMSCFSDSNIFLMFELYIRKTTSAISHLTRVLPYPGINNILLFSQKRVEMIICLLDSFLHVRYFLFLLQHYSITT